MKKKEKPKSQPPKPGYKRFVVEIPISLEQRVREEAQMVNRSRNAQIKTILESRYEIQTA